MMKYFKHIAGLIVAGILMVSCQKDLSEENGNLPGGGTTNGGTGSGGTGSIFSKCKDCIYIPLCDGSVYKYADTSAGLTPGSTTVASVNYTIHFNKDSTINGVIYQKLTAESNNSAFYNCTAGATTVIAYNAVSNNGNTLSYAKTTLLKANEVVGGSWTDQIINPQGLTVTYVYSIVSKGTARTVNNVAYPDVIHVHSQSTFDFPGFGTIPSGQAEYYFAKGVGQIESILTDDFTGTQILHRTLVSAVIP